MLSRTLRLTRIAGIDVRLDPSLLLFAVLVAWIFGASFLDRHALPVAIAMAAVATVLFFASVLVHELAHGLEARYRDIRVHAITLFFFGGMTEMHSDSASPRDEFAVSAVGPYASLVCGAAFGLVSATAPVLGGGLAVAVGDVAGLLGWLNVFLAAFNLIPGAPLDGGRVLRAGLWWLLDDRLRAVRIVGRTGQALATAVVMTGVWVLVFVADARVFGAVLAMVGVFIFQAARAEIAQGEMERLLDERRVGSLLEARTPPLEADRPLDLVDPGRDDLLLPVVAGDRVVGTLPPARIRGLHPTDRAARSAGEIMDPLDPAPEVTPDSRLRELVDHLLGSAEAVVVRDAHGPVAVLREADVARALQRLRREGRRGRRSGPAPRPEEVGG